MKKYFSICLILLIFLVSNLCCLAKQSLNTFNINISEVPAQPVDDSSKLSDGAIAAIALGSTFGGLGILSGIGYYFYKNSKNLKNGLVCGQKCPYQTVDCSEFSKILANKKNYTYLMKASTKSVLDKNYRYLIIPDTEVKSKTFNTVFFELPKTNNNNINFRIIQASMPYKLEKNIPSLDSNIFINPKDKNVKKLPTYTKELNPDNGFLIKQGTIKNTQNNLASITIQNTDGKTNQTYAIIVEFEM